MRIVKSLAVCLLSAVLGCSGSTPAPEANIAPPSAAKPLLEAVAASGEVGSGIMQIREALDGMKKTDAAKADKLLKELDELQKMGSGEAVKAKAKAMASQL
jgi:hypothetical protein